MEEKGEKKGGFKQRLNSGEELWEMIEKNTGRKLKTVKSNIDRPSPKTNTEET